MATAYKRLEITPDLLDLGGLVVRLDKIVSVGKAERRPLRPVGALLLLIAAGLLGFEFLFNPMAFTAVGKGSVKIWAACVAAGLGTFSLIYAQRCLAIAVASGGPVLLRIANQPFADQLLAELRRAIAHRPGTPLHVVADLVNEKILATDADDPHAGHRGAMPYGQAGPHPSGPPYGPYGVPQPSALEPMAPAAHGNGAYPQPPPHVNGAGWPPLASPVTLEPPRQNGYPMAPPHAQPQQRPPVNGTYANGHGPSLAPNGAANGVPYGAPRGAQPPLNGGGPMAYPGPLTAGPRPGAVAGNRDLAALIETIATSGIEHKEALLELLRVVEDHELGGRTSREDALSHWQSFAEYAGQYLSGVDRVPALTAQVGRSMTRLA